MGTRCSIMIKSGTRKEAQLYHHWDGYPENMFDLIAQAYGRASRDRGLNGAGKAANYLVCVDPGGFEFEPIDTNHGDWEFFYVVDVEGYGESQRWDVTCRAISYGQGEAFGVDRRGRKRATMSLQFGRVFDVSATKKATPNASLRTPFGLGCEESQARMDGRDFASMASAAGYPVPQEVK